MKSYRSIKTLHDAINSYAALPLNWDNDGANPPTDKCITKSLDFLKCIPMDFQLPTIMLGQNGSGAYIGFYWDDAQHYMDIEIDIHGEISCFKRDNMTGTEYYAENIEITPEWLVNHFSAT